VSNRIHLLRTSERRDAKRCWYRWYWAWRCGLKPIGSISDALWFGTGVHLALAAWYCGPGLKRGRHPAATFEEWADGEIRHIKTSERWREGAVTNMIERLEPARDLGVALLEGYVELYGKDEHMHVIQPEYAFQIDICDPEDWMRVFAIYAGTYDLVWRDLRDDFIKLEEHKTAKAIILTHLPMDDQAGSYWAVAWQTLLDKGMIKQTDRLRGIEYNFIRKAMPNRDKARDADGYYRNKPQKADYVAALEKQGVKLGPRLSLAALEGLAIKYKIEVLGEISKVQPAPIYVRDFVVRSPHERATQISRIQDELLHMEALRTGALPLTKNPTMNCSWDCSFFDMCQLHEAGHAWEDYRNRMYRQEDPYADHRKSTEE
jgi:Zierdtviridae exonuclease